MKEKTPLWDEFVCFQIGIRSQKSFNILVRDYLLLKNYVTSEGVASYKIYTNVHVEGISFVTQLMLYSSIQICSWAVISPVIHAYYKPWLTVNQYLYWMTASDYLEQNFRARMIGPCLFSTHHGIVLRLIITLVMRDNNYCSYSYWHVKR